MTRQRTAAYETTHLQVLENKFQQEEIKSHGYLLKRFKQIDNEAGYCSASGQDEPNSVL